MQDYTIPFSYSSISYFEIRCTFPQARPVSVLYLSHSLFTFEISPCVSLVGSPVVSESYFCSFITFFALPFPSLLLPFILFHSLVSSFLLSFIISFLIFFFCNFRKFLLCSSTFPLHLILPNHLTTTTTAAAAAITTCIITTIILLFLPVLLLPLPLILL